MLMCFFGVYLWCICTCVWQLQVCLVSVLYIPGCKCVHVCVFCVQMGLCSWGCTPGLTFTSFPRSCFESVEWNDHVICTHTASSAAVISPAVFSFPPAKERVEMCVWVNVWEQIICVCACVERERDSLVFCWGVLPVEQIDYHTSPVWASWDLQRRHPFCLHSRLRNGGPLSLAVIKQSL